MVQKIKNVVVLLVIFTFSPLGLISAENLLKNRLLKKDGKKILVTGYRYIGMIVNQVGGVVIFTPQAGKILKEIKLPTYYVKNQLLGDLVNNFCNLYKRLSYKFEGNKLIMSVPEKRTAKTTRLVDSGFEEGSFFVGVGWTVNFFRPYTAVGSFKHYSSTLSYSIRSFSLEYMVKDWLGVNLDIQGFSVDSTPNYVNIFEPNGPAHSYDGGSGDGGEGGGIYFNLMANFHLQAGPFNFFAGVGVAILQFNDFNEPILAVRDELSTDLRGWNIVPTFALGGYVRIFGKFFFGGRFTLGYLGLATATGGIYVKL